MAEKDPLADIRELAELLKPAWAQISAGIPTWHPRCEGDEEQDADDADEKDDADDADKADEGIDWKAMARKHEREAKKARKTLEDREAKLKEREDADKSDRQKELDAAREEAKREALTEAQKDRRQDRLEVAVTRLASKGVKVGAGDDAKTLKFADPEDALVFIERAIARHDLDEDDIYDNDGKVQTDAVTEALADLLERKPNLAAAASNGGSDGRLKGDADAGKGSGRGKSLDDMSVEEHAKRKYART